MVVLALVLAPHDDRSDIVVAQKDSETWEGHLEQGGTTTFVRARDPELPDPSLSRERVEEGRESNGRSVGAFLSRITSLGPLDEESMARARSRMARAHQGTQDALIAIRETIDGSAMVDNRDLLNEARYLATDLKERIGMARFDNGHYYTVPRDGDVSSVPGYTWIRTFNAGTVSGEPVDVVVLIPKEDTTDMADYVEQMRLGWILDRVDRFNSLPEDQRRSLYEAEPRDRSVFPSGTYVDESTWTMYRR